MIIPFFRPTDLTDVQLSALTNLAMPDISSSARTSQHTRHEAHGSPGSESLSDPFKTPVTEHTEDGWSFSFGGSELFNKPLPHSRTSPSALVMKPPSLEDLPKACSNLTGEYYRGLVGQYPSSVDIQDISHGNSVQLEDSPAPVDKDAHPGYIDLMAGNNREPEHRHAFTLGRTEPNIYMKELQPSFMASMKAWSRAVHEALHISPTVEEKVTQPAVDHAVFAGVKFWCCHCRRIDHFRGTTEYDVDCAEQYRCIYCGHCPCLLCRYNSQQLACFDNKVRVPLEVWEAKENRVLPRWICCKCGSACLARMFRERHRSGGDRLLVFAGSTCSNCKHDCCDGCACFLMKPDGEKADELLGESRREAGGNGVPYQESPPTSPLTERTEKRLPELLHKQGRPLRQVGPKRQLMRSISVKVWKVMRI